VYVIDDNWPLDIIESLPETDKRILIASLDRHYTHRSLYGFDLVVSGTTGTDHLDVRDIPLISLKGDAEFLQGVFATAEMTLALMLALLRHIPQAHADVLAGRWEREKWRGSELHGKTVGIVGHGRVGKQVEAMLQGFGVEILTHDKTYPDIEAYNPKQLRILLQHSDIITVHVPLNDSTRGMFGYEQFCLMKPTAYFINTSRGAVVDEDGSLRALREGKIAGAALDVVCDEPNVNPALLEYARTHDNLIITPHLGGNTHESRRKTQLRCVEKIRDWLERT
jgi:D-3-phosphoglycerate dehydrogenase